MKWFAKKVFDGRGGKDLKNRYKSYSYLYSIFKKFKNLYQKLTFVRYNKIGGAGARAQEGPGASHSWKFFLTTVCRSIKKFISRMKCRPLLLRTANRGAILIEFAVCMPILIILLFYINDLVKIKRYYSQTEFVAQQAVNMIQNISQNRTDKRITRADLQNIVALSSLAMYPGLTRFKNSDGRYVLGHTCWINFHCVKGLGDGSVQRVWYLWRGCCDSGRSPSEITGGANVNCYTETLWNSNKLTYPSIKIDSGKIKIIVEAYYCRYPNGYCSHVNDKQSFDLHLFTPKRVNGNGNWYTFFQLCRHLHPKTRLI